MPREYEIVCDEKTLSIGHSADGLFDDEVYSKPQPISKRAVNYSLEHESASVPNNEVMNSTSVTVLFMTRVLK